MSPTRIARLLLRSVTAVVAVASATYVLVYLYRWEWHRALMSGVIFVAAELGLIGGLLLGRLSELERRLAEPAAAVAGELGAASVGSAAASAPGERPFAWMDPNRLGVFVPVLMGAGAVLSGLAYLVERSARFIAAAPRRPGEGRSALGPADGAALPTGGFLAPSPPRRLEPRHRRSRFLLVTVALLAAAFAVTALVDVVADLTESRPDPVQPELATEIVLRIGYHNYDRRSALGAASALVEACRTTVPERTRFAPVELVEGRRVRLTTQPALGRHEIRRFRGCIGDATLDRVHATIEEVRTVPVEALGRGRAKGSPSGA